MDSNRDEILRRLRSRHRLDYETWFSFVCTACRRGWLDLVKILFQDCPSFSGGRSARSLIAQETSPLHCACSGGHLNIVRYLVLEQKNNPHVIQDKNGFTPLHYACKGCHLNVVRYLITLPPYKPITSTVHRHHEVLFLACRRGYVLLAKMAIQVLRCDPNVKDKYQLTPLHVARLHEHTELYKQSFLTSLVHDVDSFLKQTIEKETSLEDMFFLACKVGHLGVVKYMTTMLADFNFDPSLKNRDQHTALSIACHNHNIDIVAYLIGLPTYIPEAEDKIQVLLMACRCGELLLIQKVVEDLQWNPDVRSADQQTPLYIASLHGHMNIVRYLLKLSNYKPTNDVCFAKTFFEVCKQDHFDILKLAIEMGKCDPLAIRDKYQRTLLHIACQHNLIDVAQYLTIEQGFDLNVRDKESRTPLHSACLLGHINIVEYLTSRKECNLNAKNSSKRTPLHSAAIRGHVKIVQYLVTKRKCNPSVADKDQRTPLHFACQYGHINVVRYLCKQGCLPSVEDRDRRTPLHYASQNGYIVVIEYLIMTKKCSPSALDKDHHTPLHFACYNHRYDAVKCLLRISDKTDINAKDKDNKVPFEMIKCREGLHKLLHFLFEIPRLTDNEIVKLLKQLMATAKWDSAQKTSNDETVLHFASRTERTKVVQYLLTETCCNTIINTKNTKGESPLLLAKNQDIIIMLIKHGANLHDAHRKLTCELADSEAIQTMKYLIQNKLWDPNLKCDSGNALHFACKANREQIVSYLLSEAECNPNDKNSDGKIPLQLTNNPEIIFELIRHATDRQLVYRKLFQDLTEDVSSQIITRLTKPTLLWNPCVPLDNGDTALHHACRTDRSKIVNFLLSKVNCDPNVRNYEGASPLDLTSNPMIIGYLTQYGADLEKVYTKLTNKMAEDMGLEVVKYLSREDKLALNKRTSRGDNVLHFVCRANKSRLVHYLLCETNCEINAENTAGEFPLQSTTIDIAIIITNAAEQRALQIVTHIIIRNQDFHCNGMALQGASILHLACQFNKSSIVRYLLAEAHLNPCAVNNNGETPIQLASDPEIVRGLIQYGANPPNVYKTHGKILGQKRQPPQPSVKIFVIGNHAVGKSTLILAIKRELSFMTRTLTPKKKVTNVDEKTAGVIPHEFNSKRYGQVTLYDLAGQREFYSGHSCLLQNASHSSSSCIFLVVLNLCDSDEKIKQNLLFWLSFIKDPSASSRNKPHVIVIGSHADIFKTANRNIAKLEKFVSSVIRKSSSSSMIEYCGIVPLDCRYFKSAGMTDLCSCLKKSCDAIRPQDAISFNAHCFQLYLFNKFRESTVIQIKEVRAQLSQTTTDFRGWDIDRNVIKFIPTSFSSLSNICNELSSRGHILYFKDETSIENSWIIIDKMALLSTINGTIFAPENLKEHCQLATSTGVVPLSKLMNHFPNQNSKILVEFLSLLEFCYEVSDHQVIELIEKHHLPEEKYLFFPGLIRLTTPDKVWEPDPRFTYSFGWSLQCTQSEDFFKFRLIQVLLLRLAFYFALVPSRGEMDDDFPAFQRKSSVWKSGIFWGNRYGVETLVEVLPCNKEIIMHIRGQENNLVECLQLQSQVLKTVRGIIAELCAMTKTEESILDPSILSEYPIRTINKFSMAEIAKTMIVPSGCPSVVSPTGTQPIQSLLPFEPYVVLGEFVISQLCNRAKETNKITDTFISYITQRVSKQEGFAPIFIRMFSGDSSRQSLSDVLHMWRENTSGTYQLLQEMMDQYSVMTASDIMDLAGISPSLLPLSHVQGTGQMMLDSENHDDHISIGGKPKLQELTEIKRCVYGPGGVGVAVQVINNVAPNWEELAIALGFKHYTIKTVQRDHKSDAREACRQILSMWLEQAEENLVRPVTWATLIQCLVNAELSCLAEELRESFYLRKPIESTVL